MNVMVPFPDQFAARFGSGAERERRVLEVLALEEYRAGRMDKAELGEVLGLATAGEVERFLGARDPAAGGVAAAVGDERHAQRTNGIVERFQAFADRHSLDNLDLGNLIAEGRR